MTVTWRPAVPQDLPRLEELWHEQEERFRDTDIPVDRPQLFSDNPLHPFYPYRWPILHVAVAEEDGVVTGFQTTEAVAEASIITGSRAVMRSLGVRLTEEARWAKEAGMRSGWGLIPAKFADAVAHFLRAYPHIRPWKSLTPVGINFSELGD